MKLLWRYAVMLGKHSGKLRGIGEAAGLRHLSYADSMGGGKYLVCVFKPYLYEIILRRYSEFIFECVTEIVVAVACAGRQLVEFDL